MNPQETVERALAASRCDECVVIADEISSANLRWAGNNLTTNGVSRSRQLTVIAADHTGGNVRTGVISGTGVRPGQIEDLVRSAEKAATENAPAQDAQPLLGPGGGQAFSMSERQRTQPGWEDPVTGTEIGVFRAFASDLGGAFERARADGHLLYGFAEHEVEATFVGTSSGLRLRHDQPTGKAQINAKSADLTRSTWAGQSTRDFTDVDVAALNATLAQQLEWARRRVDLPPGRYETLLSPSPLADLMLSLVWAAGARDTLDGRTVFSKPGGGTRIGERLAALPLTLRTDPGAPGLACAPFVIARASTRTSSVFDNGLALAPTDWIRDGSLAALTQTRHSAALSGLPVTPPGDNLILDGGGTAALADMIASTGHGLLVNCLWYIREVNPRTLLLTGLTRDGVYLVERGEVTAAVNNFRFNESPVAALDRITEVGATQTTLPREWNDYFTRAAMPPARVEGFNMSSVSPAN